jgi:hypothetical protein
MLRWLSRAELAHDAILAAEKASRGEVATREKFYDAHIDSAEWFGDLEGALWIDKCAELYDDSGPDCPSQHATHACKHAHVRVCLPMLHIGAAHMWNDEFARDILHTYRLGAGWVHRARIL